MLDQLVMKVLGPLLDRIGSGWKSILGLFLAATILLAGQMGWISAEHAQWAYDAALLLFGLGIYHRVAKAGNGPAPN